MKDRIPQIGDYNAICRLIEFNGRHLYKLYISFPKLDAKIISIERTGDEFDWERCFF